MVAPAVEPVVKARDAAIVGALRMRKWTAEGLLHVLPVEVGQTADERKTALENALIRLSARKQILQLGGEWALA